jgi:hypothetical protein
MVPFTRAAVPEIDLAVGKLVIEPLDGLLDDRPVEVESDGNEIPLLSGEGGTREAGG